jgi:hypothetical protein
MHRMDSRTHPTSRGAVLLRVLWLMSVLAVAFTLPARADAPSTTPTVRIQAYAIEAGWHEGTLTRSDNGCTVVDLATPSGARATSVSLAAIDWLEVRRNGTWSTVLVERLLSKEPAACRAIAVASSAP